MQLETYRMLERMFFVGVLAPTIIVVILFIIFLICWFKCKLREKIYEKFGRNNSATSSVDGGGIQNPARSRDFWEEDMDKNDRIIINIQNNNTKYKPGNFPLLTKQPNWRYMSSNSIAQTRDQILRERERGNTKIWTTQSDSSLSVDSGASLEGTADLESNGSSSGLTNINQSDITSVDVHRDSGFGSFAESGSEHYNGTHLVWNQYNKERYSPKRRLGLQEKHHEQKILTGKSSSPTPELYAELDALSIVTENSNVYPNQRLPLEGYNKRLSHSKNDNQMIEMQKYYGQNKMPIAGIHSHGADV